MAVIPSPPHTPIDLPLPSLDGKVLWLEDPELATAISEGLAIGAPEIFAGLALGGMAYSVADWLFPQTAAIYNEGNNWYDKIVNLRNRLKSPAFKGVSKWVTASVTDGLYSRDPELTKLMLATAHAVHDFTVEIGHFADTEAQSLYHLRYVTVPREIRYYTRPLRVEIGKIKFWEDGLDAVARGAGYKNAQRMLKAWVPSVKEVRVAERYVRTQKHKNLTGALSFFQTRAKQLALIIGAAESLGFKSVPALERYVVNQVRKVLPLRIGKVEVKLKKLTLKLKPLLDLSPVDLGILAGLGTLAGFTRMFRRVLPDVCVETGDCAAGNLAGKGNWNIFKDLLKLLLFGALDLLVVAELCTIVGAVKDVVGLMKEPLREIAVVEGGLFSVGCAGRTPPLPPPAYT